MSTHCQQIRTSRGYLLANEIHKEGKASTSQTCRSTFREMFPVSFHDHPETFHCKKTSLATHNMNPQNSQPIPSPNAPSQRSFSFLPSRAVPMNKSFCCSTIPYLPFQKKYHASNAAEARKTSVVLIEQQPSSRLSCTAAKFTYSLVCE